MFAKMKKLILLSTLLSLVYFSQSQVSDTTKDLTAESSFRLGLHFTPTIGFVKSDKKYVTSGGSSIGYNFGLIGDFKFGDNYYFGTGIDIVSSPVKITVDTLKDQTGTFGGVLLKYKLSYIGIPLTLKLKTKEIHYMKYYGQFGVEPQFNINKKVNVNKGQYAGTDFVAPSETLFSNYNDDISFIRLGLIIGGGIEYSIGGKTSLVAGLSYNGGFTGINKEKDLKITNSYVALTLGVLF